MFVIPLHRYSLLIVVDCTLEFGRSNCHAKLSNGLQIFGAVDKDTSIGFTQKTDSNVNVEETVMPYLDCIADFRKSVKKNAAACKDMEALKLCDQLRDDVLPFLGVRMEDIDGKNIDR